MCKKSIIYLLFLFPLTLFAANDSWVTCQIIKTGHDNLGKPAFKVFNCDKAKEYNNKWFQLSSDQAKIGSKIVNLALETGRSVKIKDRNDSSSGYKTADALYLNSKIKLSRVTIVPSPTGAIYLGQHEIGGQLNDVANFEATVGFKTVLHYNNIMIGEEGDVPTFNVAEAKKAYAEGRILFVRAVEASPTNGFTVDKLLSGVYDSKLKKLAGQFREFGKPMYFEAAREPNIVLGKYLGGFGPDGSWDIHKAHREGKVFNQFDIKKFKNQHLYKDLLGGDLCDGVERLIAAHRYYYDFFVTQEGLEFLMFDTMGWNTMKFTLDPKLASCYDFEKFYPGDKYVDVIGIDYYMDADVIRDGGGDGITVAESVKTFDGLMSKIAKVAPNKPVMIVEFGVLDNTTVFDSEFAASKFRLFFDLLKKYKNKIYQVNFWNDTFLIDKKSPKRMAVLMKFIKDNPNFFTGEVHLSDGTILKGDVIAPSASSNDNIAEHDED